MLRRASLSRREHSCRAIPRELPAKSPLGNSPIAKELIAGIQRRGKRHAIPRDQSLTTWLVPFRFRHHDGVLFAKAREHLTSMSAQVAVGCCDERYAQGDCHDRIRLRAAITSLIGTCMVSGASASQEIRSCVSSTKIE